LIVHMTICQADYYRRAPHEAASKFIGHEDLWAKYSAGNARRAAARPMPNNLMDFFWPIRFN
jgi:hypothetical protein